jgi:hypothetical protein
MDYDAYSRQPPRATVEPDYEIPSDPTVPISGYSTNYPSEPRDTSNFSQPRAAYSMHMQEDKFRDYNNQGAYAASPPTMSEAGTVSSAGRAPSETSAPSNVSPELIAEITERIKKEGSYI